MSGAFHSDHAREERDNVYLDSQDRQRLEERHQGHPATQPLPWCDDCKERRSTHTTTRTLEKHGKPIMTVTANVCDQCDDEQAAWDVLFRVAMTDTDPKEQK